MTQDTPLFSQRASWLEIKKSHFLHNIKIFRSLISSNCTLGVVVKGNAYGHGLREVVPIIHGQVDVLHVIAPQDAFEIRKIEKGQNLKSTRILVIGALSSEEILECARLQIEVTLADPSWKNHFTELKNRLKTLKLKIGIHIHLDTGLGREGFHPQNLPQELSFLKEHADLFTLRGIMSHFSNTEDVTEQTYAQVQMDHFESGITHLKDFLNTESAVETHISASAATLVLPKAQNSHVRIGITLYGLWSSVETRISSQFMLRDLPIFKPTLTWKCRSQIIKTLKKGSYVGYGCTFRCAHDTQIAVFPVGYFDGYPRMVSGKAHVLIQGKRCAVIGRVMMNHIIVDINDIHQTEFVEATLLGQDEEEIISAEMIANWAQTIHYEVVARLGAHLERKVLN